MYQFIFNNFFRRIDAETAHKLVSGVLKALPPFAPVLRRFTQPHPALRVRALGTVFPSPFGLAAGFDKNAEEIIGLGALGFGHVEVGTLTKHPQEGNEKPRLFRLVEDRALINRMGFNNGGAAAAAPRIAKARRNKHRPVIGVNIGKSRITPVADAVADYVDSTQRLKHLADYIAVNVSSPNTPGLRGLQEESMLRPLLEAVHAAAESVPVLVKIAPDLDDEQIDGIVALAAEIGLAGIITHNTTIARTGLKTSDAEIERIGAGGLSGKPLADRSLEVLKRVRKAAPENDFVIISVGGVTTADDVIARLNAGADLVQGYTAFIYEGPRWAAKINQELYKRGWRGNV
ncbi:quinone-dependent dihydroorotate dehydrogenase [Canibacter zhoujuaniae]|uniref:quinone-dependent dihydroorotate dehydrogenase n=1 Tax=Canibacter zhoujuaniae TaxID=2708343 RepID=UPI0014233095|nr:quinone-dependent dihydroorotate dehydrogenase [Canibacter zhoujuaniae]